MNFVNLEVQEYFTVAIDDPKKEYAYGSTVAAPVAQKVIESLLVLEKIPPSDQMKIFSSIEN